jgi:hypothetical protein
MNFCKKDFIQILSDNSKNQIPANVLTELNNFKSKFGTVVLLGEDVLKISNPNILKEVFNNEHLKKYIYKVEDNLLYIKANTIKEIFDLFENEIGYPIEIHHTQIPTHLIEIYDEGTDLELCHSVKAIDSKYALKILYDQHVEKPPYTLKFFSKKELQAHMHIHSEPTEEDILKYMEYLYDNRKELNLFLFVREIGTSYSSHSPQSVWGRTYW